MQYLLTIIFSLSFTWLINVSCQSKGNGGKASNNTTLHSTDTIYTISSMNPSFQQTLKDVASAGQKKFVRITAREIINPAQLAITFDLYYITGNKTEFLGSVAPFPSDNPGSYIIATAGKLKSDGELELRLKFPEDWNKKDRLEVKFKKLTLE